MQISDCGLRIGTTRSEGPVISNPQSDIRNPQSLGVQC